MRALSDQEKRTIRLGVIVLAAGLCLAVGLWCYKRAEARRVAYQALLVEAGDVRSEIDRYTDKAALAKKLMDNFHLDPMTLARTSIVAQASAAIQQASRDAGVGVGAIRETPARDSSKEIASIQFEGMGQVPSIMALLYQLERAGAPLIVDSVRITSDSRRPSGVKVNVTIIVLDFDQWKAEGGPNA
jgi:hypothetical protein